MPSSAKNCVKDLKIKSFIALSFCFQYPHISEKAMAPHSSTLAWKIPWMEELVGCSPWGR